MNRKTLVRRSGALLAATSLLALSAATPAFAASNADGDVDVVNTETVQVYMNADGEIETKRVYEQVALTGKGKVHLDNPISTTGLRNLDGFSGFDAKSGHQVIDTEVDGEKKLRSVSDFTGQLPLDIAMTYELDGRPVEPGDLVGESGHLVVTFDVKNTTTQTQQVSFPDGRGGTITKMAQVPVPVVGSLSTGAPSNFTNVTSKQANLAGDGKGGTKLSFTMTLFPPVGKTTTSFSYEADVTDAVVPRIDVSALPVNPLEVPTFASAADSYQGGADTGAKLTDGAVQIDSNLLKLRDGAAELLAGLLKLRDGAGQLSDGLNDEAAPGAAKLAAGAEELSFGLIKIDDGAGKLSDGAGKLADGTQKASTGSKTLSAGAKKLSNGLNEADSKMPDLAGGSKQLADGTQALVAGIKKLRAGIEDLPATVKASLQQDPQYLALLGALQSIADGVGNRTDLPTAGTLLGGLNGVQYAMRAPGTTDCAAADPSNCGAMDGAQEIRNQLNGAILGPADVLGTLANLEATINSIKGTPDCGPVCQATTTQIAAGVKAGLAANMTKMRDALESIYTKVDAGLLANGAGLDRLRAGLNNPNANPNCLVGKQTPSPTDDCGIKEAALFLKTAGIPLLVDGIAAKIQSTLLAGIGQSGADCKTGDQAQLLPCAEAIADGQGQLNDGIKKLVDGIGQLSAGGVQLSDGAAELSGGLGQINDGAGQLSDGAGQLADGTGKASDGSKQLSDGAGQLSDGLGAAADGSTQIADGLGQAAGGAPKLVDGASRLSKEGTKKLIAAGELTTAQYGEMVAVIKAGAERADAEKMAYGAPEGAVGRTAYSYIIEGEDGEGTRNVARAIGGLATLGAAGGLFLMRRRFLV